MSRQFTWWRRFWATRKMPKQMLYKAASELQQRIEFGEYEVDNLGREYMLEELIFEQKEKALKKGSFSTAGNMEIARGKAAGLYIDRKIIKTGKLEDLSEQELENKMKQILEDYAPILNAKQIDGEVISSESSSPTDEESSFDPQK